MLGRAFRQRIVQRDDPIITHARVVVNHLLPSVGAAADAFEAEERTH